MLHWSVDNPIEKSNLNRKKKLLCSDWLMLVLQYCCDVYLIIISFTQNTTNKMSDCVQVNLRITTNSNQGIILLLIFCSSYYFFLSFFRWSEIYGSVNLIYLNHKKKIINLFFCRRYICNSSATIKSIR